MKLIITFLFFLSFFQLTYAAYPTQWLLVSQSDQEICIKCEGKASGLPSAIPFQQCFINQKKVVWNGWYNDGLGLN